MSDSHPLYKVQDLKVGQRVVLMGDTWKDGGLHGSEVEIQGHEVPHWDYNAPAMPYFRRHDEEEKYYIFQSEDEDEDWSAEVIEDDRFYESMNQEALLRLHVPGVGVGVATSQEDFERMKHLVETGEIGRDLDISAAPPVDPIENAFQMRDWDEYERLVEERKSEWVNDYHATVVPDHYQFGDVRVIDIAKHLGFLEGNILKYVARAGRKPGTPRAEDLRKAKRYLDLAIEQAEAGE